LSSLTSRNPDRFQRRLLDVCASIASIVFQRQKSIQENRRWQKQLQTTTENLAVTIESIADGLISTDINGDIVIFNEVAEALTGWQREDALGKSVDDVFNVVYECSGENGYHPAVCMLDDNRCFQNDDNITLVSRDGQSRYISLSESPVKDEQGNITGVVVAFRDITQQRSDRVKKLESQQRLHSIVENTADALYLVEANGNIIDVNQTACDMLGYSREELLSMSVPDIQQSMPTDTYGEFFASLVIDQSVTVEGLHRRKDGSCFPVEVRLRQFVSNNQMLVVALARDISDRKQAEEEIIKARKLESIGLLAGGIAHDFNNLLGIIMGNIDLGRRCLEQGSNGDHYLVKAGNASKRAADLTQQLLTFSKGGDPVKKTSDIKRIIRESAEFSLHGSNVQPEYSCRCVTVVADVDDGQISQVIQNLVINARQAMPEGGSLRLHCENAAIHQDENEHIAAGDYIKITVQDSGEGIPDDIIHSVFDPYFTTKQEGSGLGLALSYSIIKKHRGYIFVDSERGKGTTFTIYLPVGDISARPDEAVACDTAAGSGVDQKGRIMIMDDDAMIREIGEAMLQNLGYEVVQAVDGEEALALYQAAMQGGAEIDLVIMDLTVLSGTG
ncbi:MAG TPA: PAS domain-containing sensor histidine kinase, partial [Thiotrichales bacterium]|nr:PAS domain-containing sensor histidine kinase [Thiotrichales bacterium]